MRNDPHTPIVIIVPRSVGVDLLGATEFCQEYFGDVAHGCQCPQRDGEHPCPDHQHDLLQSQLFALARTYVAAEFDAADRIARRGTDRT